MPRFKPDPDFIAVLTFRTFAQGGRSTPAFSGYRPQIKFEFDEKQTSGSQYYIGKEMVNPGETVLTEIKILSVSHFANRLSVGMPFEFREGSRVIGTGIITKIINEELSDSPILPHNG